MWTMLLMICGAGIMWWAKHKATIWYQSLPKRRALASTARADAKEENKRPLAQRAHTLLPDRTIRKILRWNPESGKRPDVRIARRGFLGWERIRPDQHIVCIGMTGSGKSSTLRVLGAWALLKADWCLEAWDGKWGASVKAYKGKCPVLTTMAEIEARLQDLVDRELPLRADMAEPPHLAIIMDESRLLNMLSDTGMKNLITVIQTGRELGVHLWFGLQDPKADSVPTAIRDQFSGKLVHILQNQDAAQVALKELVTAGWHPHKLMRPGQMLVWTPIKGQRPGRVCFGLWLAPARLAALTPAGPIAAPVSMRPTDRPTEQETPVHALTKASVGRLPERQALALMVLGNGKLSAAELAQELGTDRKRARETAQALVAKGLVVALEDGTYTATEATS